MRRRIDSIVETALAPRWVRRLLGVATALLIAAWPMDVVRRFGVDRNFTLESWVVVVWWGIGIVLVLFAIASSAFPKLGLRPAAALVGLIPVVGAVFLVVWFWRLSPFIHSKAERAAFRERLVARLGEFDREVYRLRFNVDSDQSYSRRKTAMTLGASQTQVRDAEIRIEAAIAALESSSEAREPGHAGEGVAG